MELLVRNPETEGVKSVPGLCARSSERKTSREEKENSRETMIETI